MATPIFKSEERINLTLSIKHHSLLIMAQELIQTLSAQGRTYREYRDEPDATDLIVQQDKEIVVKVHLNFPDDLYEYPHPKFGLGQKVVIADEWYYCQENGIDFSEENEIYPISAIEFVEPTSRVAKGLVEDAYFMYGIRGVKGKGTIELAWFAEPELLALYEINTGEF